ncbi:unnamed protein product, partial [Ectocarpus sp. 13 AM-2016]
PAGRAPRSKVPMILLFTMVPNRTQMYISVVLMPQGGVSVLPALLPGILASKLRQYATINGVPASSFWIGSTRAPTSPPPFSIVREFPLRGRKPGGGNTISD